MYWKVKLYNRDKRENLSFNYFCWPMTYLPSLSWSTPWGWYKWDEAKTKWIQNVLIKNWKQKMQSKKIDWKCKDIQLMDNKHLGLNQIIGCWCFFVVGRSFLYSCKHFLIHVSTSYNVLLHSSSAILVGSNGFRNKGRENSTCM